MSGIPAGAWERRKVELRRLETDIETHLIQLENLDVTVDLSEVCAVHQDAKRLVSALQQSAVSLMEFTEGGQGEGGVGMRVQAERYTQVANEKERALAQVIQALNAKRSRHQLLDDVQHDIEAYSESHGQRLLGNEADHINKATQDAQRLQNQAMAAHQQMKDQHSVFARAHDRASTIIAMAPGLDGILTKIQSKRQRDAMYVLA